MPHLLHVVLLMPLSWETIIPYMLKALEISSCFLFQKQTLADCVVSVNRRLLEQGLEKVVDTTAWDCWQVDASKVTIPRRQSFYLNPSNLLQKRQFRSALDLDGASMQLDAHLHHKLLLYKEGGHFKVHRDIEKEKGMCKLQLWCKLQQKWDTKESCWWSNTEIGWGPSICPGLDRLASTIPSSMVIANQVAKSTKVVTGNSKSCLQNVGMWTHSFGYLNVEWNLETCIEMK